MKEVKIKNERGFQILRFEEENIYFQSEINAIKLLNSKKVNHSWKKDFKKDLNANEKWDLINSEKIKIEVKSTISKEKFKFNSVPLNLPEQRDQIILKVFIDKNGKIKDYKFVKLMKGKWENITEDILDKSKSCELCVG